MCTMSINSQFNGIELTFAGKPAEAIREAMKAAGFRWHREKKLWYAKNTAERMALAQKLSGGEETPGTVPAPAAPAEVVSKYGIKVGDLLYDIWGYSMTIVEFYKVTKIISASKVEIVEVGHTVLSADRGGGEQVVPDPDMEIGSRIEKMVVKDRGGEGFHIKINDSCSLRPYHGGACYQNTWD